MTGRLVEIAIKEKSRAPMHLLSEVEVSRESGLKGDRRGHSRGRQVTVLAKEAWEQACSDLGLPLQWTARRANLLVEGLDLAETTGQRLQIGDLVLEITGETRPCERMEEAKTGLRETLSPDWRGGVTCTVISGAVIQAGDPAELLHAD